MFSGIIESKSRVIKLVSLDKLLQIQVEKPRNFDDLKVGDSISVDGVCLTVENFNQESVQFTLASESLKVTGWNKESLQDKEVNLERALLVSSRLHGHWVTGHIDQSVKVVHIQPLNDSLIIDFDINGPAKEYVWKKGCVTINGVSLTVNEVVGGVFSVCLIPETLRATNLNSLQKGSLVNLEYDFMARGIVNCFKNGLTPYQNISEISDIQLSTKAETNNEGTV